MTPLDTTDPHGRRTPHMPPAQLDKLLLPERTTANLVIELWTRKRTRNWRVVWLMALSLLAGVWLGIAALSIV